MKFRDPKTGDVFNSIERAHKMYCNLNYCTDYDGKKCPLYDVECCDDWVTNHTYEAARMMGYEVIEGDEHWLIADDGDGYVCPNCGEDFCVMIYETERFKHCPNCGKALLQPKEDNVEQKDMSAADKVDHAAHYNQGGVECIDALKAATVGLEGIQAFCAANAIKYIWRFKDKNGAEDLDKAIWYINRLKEEIGNG